MYTYFNVWELNIQDCGSATFQAFVLVIITCSNKCGMDSGVASY